jgi:predicted ATPase
MHGKPKKLEQDEEVEVHIDTEEDAAERHAVFFNRGVPDSQAYARGFDNRLPEEVPDGEAWR